MTRSSLAPLAVLAVLVCGCPNKGQPDAGASTTKPTASSTPRPTCGGAAGATCPEGQECFHASAGSDMGFCRPKPGTLHADCGGVGGLPCNAGLHCVTPPYPDAMGTCEP